MEALYNLFLQCTGVSTDSRAITDGCMFIALKGPSFNGNLFAKQAIQSGAKVAVVDEAEFVDEKNNIFLVEDGLKFLQSLANYHRNQFAIPVIGITGSNGKTSTKELIATVLGKKYNVLYTKGNLNNHIGVPLTLLQLKEEHQIAVIEMGANHFGDIKELCAIAEPTCGIITNIGKAHLEGFKDFNGVLKTKKELYDSVESRNGFLVVNSDDDVLMGIRPKDITFYSYGTKESLVLGKLERLTPYVEFSWKYKEFQSIVVSTHLVGQYNFYNFLAAISFGLIFNVDPSDINHAIASYEPTNKRSQVAKTDKNTLILDCYNANPTSMRSALESFAKIDHGSKLVIIGDMLEMGEEAEIEHLEILKLVQDLNLQGMTVGTEFAKIQQSTAVKTFYNRDEVIAFLKVNPITDHLILLKGSRGIGLEVLEDYL